MISNRESTSPGTAGVVRTLAIILLFLSAGISARFALAANAEEAAVSLNEAGRLFSEKNYQAAADQYRLLSNSSDTAQASWAYELLGVCYEKLGDINAATTVYEDWLKRYQGTVGQARVEQRLLALQTATMQPRNAANATSRRQQRSVYGSASVMHRGLVTKVEGQDSETPISSVAVNMDVNWRLQYGDWLWLGRTKGGYLSNHADGGESDGRVSAFYAGVRHESTGAEVLVGRRRSSDSGIYGYIDGISLTWPLNDSISVVGTYGAPSTSSRESAESDRIAYSLGMEWRASNNPLRLQTYITEQDYDGLTERRAVGGQVSWFNSFSRLFAVADYDVEFGELNNLMLNASWDVTDRTTLSTSLGSQRSPFLTASNAIIGEFEVDLRDYIDNLENEDDIYDAALERTALSRYGSLVLNQEVGNNNRIVAEVYHFELSELPAYDFSPNAPDSQASTSYGLQYVHSDALLNNDVLSIGTRYNQGESSESISVYADERIRFGSDANVTFRLRASQREMDDFDQEALTLRTGVRGEWYISPTLVFDGEIGYEKLLQDLGTNDFEVQQGFSIIGLRVRF